MNIEHQQGDALVASLDLALLLPRYRHSQRRLVLVDFEDTLWQRNPRRRHEGQGEGIPLEAIEVVKRLSGDSRNEVWILSGLPVKTLGAVAAQLPKVGFVSVSPFVQGYTSGLTIDGNTGLRTVAS